MKFAVLKVTSQPRNFWKGPKRWHAGNAVNLRADVRLRVTREDGIEAPFSDRLRLSWYHEDWDITLRQAYAGNPPALDDVIGRLEEASISQSLLLSRYINKSTMELIQVGEDEAEYLWLFFTSDKGDAITPVTASRYENYAMPIIGGHLIFKVTIFRDEGKLFEGQYALDFKAWNDFTITEVKE